MTQSSIGLPELLSLEPLEVNLFRGVSLDLGLPQLFGGHVLAQALAAAARTVPSERAVHSLHGYFLRPGDASRPVVYQVDPTRDGGSFTTRRITAIQYGQPIFFCSASFHLAEPGFEHQSSAAAPDTASPEALLERGVRVERLPNLPVEILRCDLSRDPPRHSVWIRLLGEAPADPALHRQMLAYASDLCLLATALLAHDKRPHEPGLRIASLDHAIWFHRDLDLHDWHLYQMDSPWAGGARGLSHGEIFDRNGVLVATTMQEGLVRFSPQSSG